MDQKQFDAVLSDAEKRLRRLKVLYEQWFVGIERVEPALSRKELEDLITRLRREQLSNTAQRFRVQQLVQRHVALSTYWRRIGRQIEEGTFQRDLLRAKRRQQKESPKQANGVELEITYDVDIDVDLTDVLAEADRAAEAALSDQVGAPQPLAAKGQLAAAPVPKNGRARARNLEGDAAQSGQAEGGATVSAKAAAAGSAPPQPIATGAFETTKLKTTQASPNAAIPAQPKLARPLVPPPPAAGKLAAPKPLGGIAPPPAAGAERKPASPPPPAADPASTGSMRAARTALRGPPGELGGNDAQRPSAGPRAISPFALPAAGSVRPQPLTPPKAPPPPPVVPNKAAATQNASAVRPQASAVARPANTNGPGASSLDVERIYSQYVAARELNQERTDNVKRDTIEKTIRSMLPNLEKKHAGKQIDFEVVVKDGKVALKPIAK